MPDNIYPDQTNVGYDIKYHQLKILASDVRSRGFNQGQVTSGPPISQPEPGDEGGDDVDIRFAVSGEDDTAEQQRSFNLTPDFNFQFTRDTDILLKLLGSTGQLMLGQYGSGTFADTPVFALGVDAAGNVIEYDPTGGGGGSGEGDLMRFAFSGEDDTADEERLFDLNGHTITLSGSVNSLGAVKIINTNGTDVVYGLSVEASGALGTAIRAIGGGAGGIYATSDDNYGVLGQSGTGTGVHAQSDSSLGLIASSNSGVAGQMVISPNNPGGVSTVLQINRQEQTTAADGIGGSIDFNSFTDAGLGRLANQIVSKWTIADDDTRTSQISITGVDSGTLQDLLTLDGPGNLTLNKYGIGSFPGTAIYGLGVDASGNVIEYDPSGGGGGGGDSARFGYPGEDTAAGEDRTFDLGTLYQINIAGNFDTAVKDSMFKVSNDADSGVSIYGKSIGSSTGILGESATGYGGFFLSVDGIALSGQSTNQLGAIISSANNIGAQITSDSTYSAYLGTTGASNNSVLPNLYLVGVTSSFPAEDGFGQSIDLALNTVNFPTVRIANQIISKWTTADDATRGSEISITGVDNAVTNDLISISGAGIFRLLQGLNEYADDTAAAAGAPVIPITGLYRTGSVVKMRVS